jgi:putative transposase
MTLRKRPDSLRNERSTIPELHERYGAMMAELRRTDFLEHALRAGDRARRADDRLVRERLRELAAERRRFGYRRLHVLVRREGHAVNKKRVQRLYRGEKPMVRRRGGRKRALGARAPITPARSANQRSSLDFAADQMTDGRRFRMLIVTDDCTRERLALVDRSSGYSRAALRA